MMKSCLKCSTELPRRQQQPSPYSTPPDSPSDLGSDCDGPTNALQQRRKSVTFCEVGEEDIFYVDDWDRSPAAVTERLTYQDVYELKELHVVLPRLQLTRRKS